MKNSRIPTVVVALIFCAFVFVLCTAGRTTGGYIFGILFGWISFLGRVVPLVRVSNDGAAFTAAVCLAVLFPGLHVSLRWLYGSLAAGTGSYWKWRWTAGLLGLIVLAFVTGTAAIGVTHQTGWLINSPDPLVFKISNRETMAPEVSENHLKQCGLGIHIYADAEHHTPVGGTFDQRGHGMHGWQTMLLPYMEQEVLYQTIDLKRPWDDPVNAKALATPIREYQSLGYPEDERIGGYAVSHYASNVHVIGAERTFTLKQLQAGNGITNTILIGEAAGNFEPWGYPANWRDPANGLSRSPDGFGGPPKQGMTQFVMADGSVRKFRNDSDPEFLRLLADPTARQIPTKEE